MKMAILAVAYGASSPAARHGLVNFEHLCRLRFGGIPVRWAYTSLLIRERIARNRRKADSVRKALMRLYFEKYDSVAIQPLQTIAGREYEDVCSASAEVRRETGLECAVGLPLMAASEDAPAVARALIAHLPEERKSGDCVVFMGHGARHPAVNFYHELGRALQEMDRNVFLGIMSGAGTLEKLLPCLVSRDVWLLPLLSIIGKHATLDMAGSAPASWKSRIESRGHTCLPVLKGTSEYAGIINIWLDNLERAITGLETRT